MQRRAPRLAGVRARQELPTDEKAHAFELIGDHDSDLRRELFRLIVAKGWMLLELRRDSQTLEDVFRDLTKGDERDATAGSARRQPTKTKTTRQPTTNDKPRPRCQGTRQQEADPMSPTFTIAKREFRSYFDSPLAYVVICLGLLHAGRQRFHLDGNFWQVDRATLAVDVRVIPVGLALLIVPVVTMRLVAEEKRSGTLEMLITLPVRDSDVILGKFLGAFGLVLVLIASTLALPAADVQVPLAPGRRSTTDRSSRATSASSSSAPRPWRSASSSRASPRARSSRSS